MKVTNVKTFMVDCFRTNWVFVKVYTDEGVDGVGEATLEYKEKYKDGNQEKEKTINAICMEIAKTVLKNGFQNVNPANNFDSLLDSISNYNFKKYLAPVRKKTGKEQETRESCLK